ncbi:MULTISPECIES: hypothetical protein [unclassified Pseudomonas]|uniref:hypothetical protein n=1 Tax=unclassified Pseudomonas TaxID=196821 RepID=UPI001F567C84|nr:MULTISPECIES: hypothetical protein [unclassified Pseudomonas]
MKYTALILAMTAALGTASFAQAEEIDPAALKNAYDMGRNSVGLINHCVDKGFLKADSTKNANKMAAFMAGMPGQVNKSDGDKIEAQGRKGEVLVNGEYQKLEGNLPPTLSLKQWCQQADQGMRNGLEQAGL